MNITNECNMKLMSRYKDNHFDLCLTDPPYNVGRKYNANGIFRFIEPSKDDKFDSNQGGNKAYFRFCETLGIECPTKKVKIEGKDVEVKELPHLSVDDINNKAVISFIDKGNPYRDKKTGEQRTPHVVKFVKPWEDGKDLTDEIPF